MLLVASRTKFSTSSYDHRLRTSRITLRASSAADMKRKVGSQKGEEGRGEGGVESGRGERSGVGVEGGERRRERAANRLRS